ncbi:lipoyl(octanoyl) transferase LipB [Candidatus Omnitrophota bacterium]
MQFKLFDLGLIDFQSAWEFQKNLFLQVKRKELISALVICRHLPVITMGRQAREENLLSGKEGLEKRKIKLYRIERGGDITYHGPGQLCVYPILNLALYRKDINWYLRSLESLLLDVFSEFGIKARTRQGLTGIWVKEQKIASIGIAIKSWITLHGMSLNVKASDLANFSLIRPCGMDIIMTSMEDILKENVEVKRVGETLTRRWHEASNFTGIG